MARPKDMGKAKQPTQDLETAYTTALWVTFLGGAVGIHPARSFFKNQHPQDNNNPYNAKAYGSIMAISAVCYSAWHLSNTGASFEEFCKGIFAGALIAGTGAVVSDGVAAVARYFSRR